MTIFVFTIWNKILLLLPWLGHSISVSSSIAIVAHAVCLIFLYKLEAYEKSFLRLVQTIQT